MKKITFYYEFASTYSYPAAMRVERVASASGVSVIWRPFLLGPIFAASGMTTSPFNLNPAKGRYMWRDLQRQCDAEGLKLVRPDPFPANTLLAARLATAIADNAARAAFSRAVYTAEFAEGKNIADAATLAPLLAAAGQDPAATMAAAASDPIKAALRASVAEAQSLGIFGAPTLTSPDGEMFWGNDRIEQAVAWAAKS